jgi:hypothetical protein
MKWFVLSLALCLTACAVTDVSMKAGDWDILYSYGMPAHPTAVSGGWVFSFPRGRDNCVSKKDANCPSVHYVTTKYTGTINKGAMIYIEGKIEADPAAVWNYHFEKANTCNAPAMVVTGAIRSAPR